MIQLIASRALEEYKSNIKVMISFGILFVFLLLFIYFEQFFIVSGTAFFGFNISVLSIIGLIFSLIYLYFFSFFVSLTVYSVKRDVQHMNFDSYWGSLMRRASVKIFAFYFIISVIVYLVFIVGVYAGLTWLSAIISFIIFCLFMYVPQSAVLDEKSLEESFVESVSFFKQNIFISAAIIIMGAVILFVIMLIEYALDLLLLPGIIVSFILVLMVLVPFMEQMKSYAFVLKFSLIKQPEVLAAHAKTHFVAPKKIDAVRLREKKSGGKI